MELSGSKMRQSSTKSNNLSKFIMPQKSNPKKNKSASVNNCVQNTGKIENSKIQITVLSEINKKNFDQKSEQTDLSERNKSTNINFRNIKKNADSEKYMKISKIENASSRNFKKKEEDKLTSYGLNSNPQSNKNKLKSNKGSPNPNIKKNIKDIRSASMPKEFSKKKAAKEIKNYKVSSFMNTQSRFIHQNSQIENKNCSYIENPKEKRFIESEIFGEANNELKFLNIDDILKRISKNYPFVKGLNSDIINQILKENIESSTKKLNSFNPSTKESVNYYSKHEIDSIEYLHFLFVDSYKKSKIIMKIQDSDEINSGYEMQTVNLIEEIDL